MKKRRFLFAGALLLLLVLACGTGPRFALDYELYQLDNGLNLYRFKYLWSEKEFVGVMAQEVQEVIPEAVFRTPEGLLNVNYDMVGTTFMPYSDWAANRPVSATA